MHILPSLKREVKEHDVRDLKLARLKLKSSYAARFSSTKCHTSAPLAQLKLNNPKVAESVLLQLETILREGRVSRDMCHAHGQHVPCTWAACAERAYISPRSVTYEEGRTGRPLFENLKCRFAKNWSLYTIRLERLEGSQNNATEEDHAENGSDQTPNQRQNPRQGRVQQVDDNLTNIKIAIPSFQGRTDPDAYLAWESKVEHVFECYNYSEQKKVRLAAMEFIDYALLWWDQLLISRRRTGEGPVRDWAEMKRIMRRQFE
ncbi:hypothetical protein GQ457_16G018640 [Hibiscus cannabinus]